MAASHLDQDYALDLLRLVFYPSLSRVSDKYFICNIEHLSLLDRAILLIQKVKGEGEDKGEEVAEDNVGREVDEGGEGGDNVEGECVTVPGIKVIVLIRPLSKLYSRMRIKEKVMKTHAINH